MQIIQILILHSFSQSAIFAKSVLHVIKFVVFNEAFCLFIFRKYFQKYLIITFFFIVNEYNYNV